MTVGEKKVNEKILMIKISDIFFCSYTLYFKVLFKSRK
jgi:hypothetical protein